MNTDYMFNKGWDEGHHVGSEDGARLLLIEIQSLIEAEDLPFNVLDKDPLKVIEKLLRDAKANLH